MATYRVVDRLQRAARGRAALLRMATVLCVWSASTTVWGSVVSKARGDAPHNGLDSGAAPPHATYIAAPSEQRRRLCALRALAGRAERPAVR